MTFVDISHITKRFANAKEDALQEITASFVRGKRLGIVGPDGAGKTTLIRLMAALLLPTSGHITIAGFDTEKEPEKIHSICGYMPQRFGLYEDLTVQQNLNLYADLKKMGRKEKEEAFSKLLSFTNLTPFTARLAKNLSGGMKQKLGLACALLKKPEILLLDEPTVGVDPISRRELWKMVQALIDQGISVIWSTAYLDEAERCDTVILLNEGKLLFQGAPSQLTSHTEGRVFLIHGIDPTKRREHLKKILGEKGVVDGTIQGDEIRVVMKSGAPHSEGVVEATKPRFEDAFVDLLNKEVKRSSLLAEKRAPIEGHEEGVIKAESLTKKFGSFVAADRVTFQVKRGEVFGLLGPNGAGKSTTFKMLCGLMQPTSGKAFCNGIDLQKAPSEARSHIGYMAQKFSLYGNLSLLQNLQFFAGIYPVSHPKRRIEEMIEIFNFSPYVDVSAELLPLGYKQRLSLAACTMHDPEILFLDEPTSGVDPITRREFWTHINGLVEKGVTVMVTTHFMDEAEYCDRIALIYNGRVIKMATPSNLKKETKASTLEEAFIKMMEYEPSH